MLQLCDSGWHAYFLQVQSNGELMLANELPPEFGAMTLASSLTSTLVNPMSASHNQEPPTFLSWKKETTSQDRPKCCALISRPRFQHRPWFLRRSDRLQRERFAFYCLLQWAQQYKTIGVHPSQGFRLQMILLFYRLPIIKFLTAPIVFIQLFQGPRSRHRIHNETLCAPLRFCSPRRCEHKQHSSL